MLRVGVKLPAATGRVGDYVAEVSALEAAGADSIWPDTSAPVSPEPWILLGAISAVTHRVWLGTMIDSGPAWPLAVDSLARLSGGRVVVGLPSSGDLLKRLEQIRAQRGDSPRPRILIVCASHADAKRSASLADGVIVQGGHREASELRAGGEFELWVDLPLPSDRAGWTEMMSAYEAAGATGIIVPWDPRIIDLLRNAGEPDDRTDLLIATG
jgi:luciferase-like monooxygenase